MIEPNNDAWIGDHACPPQWFPAFTGYRKSKLANPSLKDLPVTILKEFGIEPDATMTGRAIY